MRAIFYSIDTKLYTNIWYGSLIKAKKSHIIWPDKKWHISKPRITRRKGAKFNMKNIAKRIASLALGFALVLGIGVSLGGTRGEASQVEAATEKNVELCVSINKTMAYGTEYTITVNAPNFSDGSDNITIKVKGVYRQSANNTYYQMNKNNGYLKNTVAMPGKITSIVATWNNEKGSSTCYFAKNAEASSSDKTVTVSRAKSMTYTAPTDAEYYFFNIDTKQGTASSQLTSCIVKYVEVETKTLSSITAQLTNSTKIHYAGDTLLASDFTVIPNYDDGTSGDPITDVTGVILNNATLAEGSNTVTVSYGGVSTTVDVTAKAARTLTSISITSGLDLVNKTYTAGDAFNPTGLVITATYNDESTEDVSNEVVWTPNPLTEGLTSVTGTYDEKTVTVDGLTVSAKIYKNDFNIENGGQYTISHTKSGKTYYLSSNGTESAPSAVDDSNKATIFIFTLVGDNTFEIKTTDGKYLYSTAANNGIRVGTTKDSWLISKGSNTSGTYDLKDVTNSRFLSLYNTQDFRGYDSATAGNRTEDTDLNKYEAPSFTITGAPADNVEIGHIGELGISVTGLTIAWSSSDASVVEIVDGTYEAKAGGVATITAIDSNSGNTATCQIVVNYGEVTIAQANTLCAALGTGITSSYKVTIKDAYITTKTNTQKIYISDAVEGTSGMNSILMYDYTKLAELYTYSLINGQVTVKGTLTNFQGTIYEITNPEFTYTDTAITFAQEFNNAVASICTEAKQNDDNSSELAEIWDTLELYYDEVEATYAKPKLKEATRDDLNADIAKMIGLYDHIVKRYGTKLGDNYDFIGRGGNTSSLSNNIYKSSDNNTAISIIVIVSIVSVTTIGTYLFIRKRKQA